MRRSLNPSSLAFESGPGVLGLVKGPPRASMLRGLSMGKESGSALASALARAPSRLADREPVLERLSICIVDCTRASKPQDRTL